MAVILLIAKMNKIEKITRRKLATVFDISEVTISKTYKKLVEYVDIIIDDDKTNEMLERMEDKIQNLEITPEIKERMKQFGVKIKDMETGKMKEEEVDPNFLVISNIISNHKTLKKVTKRHREDQYKKVIQYLSV